MTLTRQSKRRLCYWLAFVLILAAPFQIVSADFTQLMASDHCSHTTDLTPDVVDVSASDGMNCCESHNNCGQQCLNLCAGVLLSIALPSIEMELSRINETPQFHYAAIEKSIVSSPQLPPPIRL